MEQLKLATEDYIYLAVECLHGVGTLNSIPDEEILDMIKSHEGALLIGGYILGNGFALPQIEKLRPTLLKMENEVLKSLIQDARKGYDIIYKEVL